LVSVWRLRVGDVWLRGCLCMVLIMSESLQACSFTPLPPVMVEHVGVHTNGLG